MQVYQNKDLMQKAAKLNQNVRNSQYKLELLLLKSLPIILAILATLTTVLNYLNIDCVIINYMMLFVIYGFIYLSSYIFKFCEYHRMPLHYVVLVNLISIYDSYIGIPVSDYRIFQLYLIILGVFILITLYLYAKTNKRSFTKNSK